MGSGPKTKNKMKDKLAKIFYFIGSLTGQFALLIQSMRQVSKHYKEFDKWMDKEIKKGKLKIK